MVEKRRETARERRYLARRQSVKTPPTWVYTWGRLFRFLGFPFYLLYRLFITHTVVLGKEHLENLQPPLIFAGTHHSFVDMPLVRNALQQTAARRFANRLLVATSVYGFITAGLFAHYAVLAFGLYPIRRKGEGDGERSLREISRLMQAGNALLIFPQGHHVRPQQERDNDPSARFRPGAARLAASLHATVVPFGLAGTEKAVPPFVEEFHGTVIAGIPVSIKRVPLVIAFGAPLHVTGGESVQAFTARLQVACYRLTRQAEDVLKKLEEAKGDTTDRGSR